MCHPTDDFLVPYSLLKHTILLEPYICFLFTLRSSPTVSEVGLPLPFVTTLDRRDEEGLFANNIRLPDVTNCLCVCFLVCQREPREMKTCFHFRASAGSIEFTNSISNTLVMYCVQLFYSVFKVRPKVFI